MGRMKNRAIDLMDFDDGVTEADMAQTEHLTTKESTTDLQINTDAILVEKGTNEDTDSISTILESLKRV